MTTTSSRKPIATMSPKAGRSIHMKSLPTAPTVTITSDYIDAVQTLNESTLHQACDWLLDGSDPDAEDKLLQTYYRCDSAVQVIQKQKQMHPHPHKQPHSKAFPSSLLLAPPLPPGAPNLSSATITSSNSSSLTPQHRLPPHRGLLPKLSSLASNNKPTTIATVATIAKGGVVPIRRTAMPLTTVGGAKTGGRMRGNSDAEKYANKKARVNSLSTTDGSDSPLAPPPSAVHFLAQLNKEDSGSGSGSGHLRTGNRTTGVSNSTTDNTTDTTGDACDSRTLAKAKKVPLPSCTFTSSTKPPLKRNPSRTAHRRER